MCTGRTKRHACEEQRQPEKPEGCSGAAALAAPHSGSGAARQQAHMCKLQNMLRAGSRVAQKPR